MVAPVFPYSSAQYLYEPTPDMGTTPQVVSVKDPVVEHVKDDIPFWPDDHYEVQRTEVVDNRTNEVLFMIKQDSDDATLKVYDRDGEKILTLKENTGTLDVEGYFMGTEAASYNGQTTMAHMSLVPGSTDYTTSELLLTDKKTGIQIVVTDDHAVETNRGTENVHGKTSVAAYASGPKLGVQSGRQGLWGSGKLIATDSNGARVDVPTSTDLKSFDHPEDYWGSEPG